ncbi:MAG TPA: hypothetical protein VNW95_05925 [Mucilaginibacter sp.]|jgi:hypothetical protein|nr:hypothetical protein [Mucilaginibacter sp.]
MQNSNKQQGTGNLEKGSQPTVQNKPDDKRIPTIVPDNDSGKPGPSDQKNSSNKGQGPAGENL